MGINRDLPIDGCGNAVNAEYLVLCGVIGFCFHQTLGADFLVKSAGDGILQNALICAVSFLGDLAGCTVLENTDSESVEIRRICFVKYRDHTQHHLGITDTAVMPPEKEMAFSPGNNSGNPSPDTVSFLGSASL